MNITTLFLGLLGGIAITGVGVFLYDSIQHPQQPQGNNLVAQVRNNISQGLTDPSKVTPGTFYLSKNNTTGLLEPKYGNPFQSRAGFLYSSLAAEEERTEPWASRISR